MVSAIIKKPVQGPIYAGRDGLFGDESADRRLHGGWDKAVCAYSQDHYPAWENFFCRTLSPGSFGENFTIKGLVEETVYLGDIYRIGMAEFQVSQPRVPCQKINRIFERNDVVRKIRSTGKSGFYLRVLKPGNVLSGDPLVLLSRPDDPISIQKSNRLWRGKEIPPGFLESILGKDFVSSAWKKDLKKL